MDDPIICPRFRPFRDPVSLSLRQRLDIALAHDNKADFMSLIKDPEFGKLRDSLTVARIFSYDPFEIATAILIGETKGLIEYDELKHGLTLLHLATIHCAPRLTKYLLQHGGKVDAVCDKEKLNLKHATPIALCTHSICPPHADTLFELLWRLCYHYRTRLEIIRMLVQHEQHSWAREAFLNYAQDGDMPRLAALFLAAPELFLKSPESGGLSLLSKLKNNLNNLEHKTHIKNQLSLLLDVFVSVGHKLAAYIRLEELAPKSHTKEEIEQTMLVTESFLRETAVEKHGDDCLDYYLSFFEVGEQNSDDDEVGEQNSDDLEDCDQEWDDWTSKLVGNDIYYVLPYLLRRTGFKRPEIHKLIPTLKEQDADRAYILSRAIEVSALHYRQSVSINEFRKPAEGESAVVKGSEIKGGGAGRGNWGTINDAIAREVEEPVAENEVNVAAEKLAGEEENVDAEKEATVNKAEEDPEEKFVSILDESEFPPLDLLKQNVPNLRCPRAKGERHYGGCGRGRGLSRETLRWMQKGKWPCF